jgi:hypothetical protein
MAGSMETSAIILLAESYGAHRGRTLSTVSTYAANDGKFFTRLKAGAGCTLKTAARLVLWFDANWPADLEWPKSIARPSTEKRAA